VHLVGYAVTLVVAFFQRLPDILDAEGGQQLRHPHCLTPWHVATATPIQNNLICAYCHGVTRAVRTNAGIEELLPAPSASRIPAAVGKRTTTSGQHIDKVHKAKFWPTRRLPELSARGCQKQSSEKIIQ